MKEDHFHLGIKALIFNDEGKLLLLKAKKFWDIPGGRIHKNESVEAALRREVLEETGLKHIEIIRPFLMILSDIRINLPGGDAGLIYSTHICKMMENEPIVLSHEHLEYDWLDPSVAATLLRVPAPFPERLAALVL
ncbi:MAG: NUDIX domain-containing protein [Verrucomicrobia bacterium]|nr:NUDIX domain-containing protein [Verrucomicrobiota bacterium]